MYKILILSLYILITTQAKGVTLSQLPGTIISLEHLYVYPKQNAELIPADKALQLYRSGQFVQTNEVFSKMIGTCPSAYWVTLTLDNDTDLDFITVTPSVSMTKTDIYNMSVSSDPLFSTSDTQHRTNSNGLFLGDNADVPIIPGKIPYYSKCIAAQYFCLTLVYGQNLSSIEETPK